MTLKQLKAFLALARTLNYVNAAAELYLSQSALSITIKTLEEELGGKGVVCSAIYEYLGENVRYKGIRYNE